MAVSGSMAISACREGAASEEPVDIDSNGSSAADSSREWQDEKEADTKLDAAMWSELDEDLQEKIIARLPFKSLFRAPSLSKIWTRKFRSSSFRSEVLRSSACSWESYGPLFANNKKELVGYDSSSKQWYRLPTLSYVTDVEVRRSIGKKRNWWESIGKGKEILESYGWSEYNWRFRGGNGCLLCWTCRDPGDPFNVHGPVWIMVTNPLAKSWKLLPPHPDMMNLSTFHIVWEGSNAYKLVLGNLEGFAILEYSIHLKIFDSTDNTWTTESCDVKAHNCLDSCSAVVNGILHMMIMYYASDDLEYSLISFDLKAKTWKEIPILGISEYAGIFFSKLFVWGAHAMVVLFYKKEVDEQQLADAPCPEWDREFGAMYQKFLSVFRLDLEHGLAVEEYSGPTSMVPDNGTCHGDYFYLGGSEPSYYSTAYNVTDRTWHSLNSPEHAISRISGGDPRFLAKGPCCWRMASIAYQPGLNTFFEV